MIKKVLKNSSYLLFAQGITKIISFFYALFLLSRLTPDSFGLYVVSLSYFSLVSSISDFGISRYLIREVSIKKETTEKLLFNVLVIRVIISFGLFVILSGLFFITDPYKLRVEMIQLGILATIPQAIALTLDGVFVAFQRLSFSALGILSLSVVTTVLGILFVSHGLGVFGVLLALILGEVAYASFALLLTKHLKVKFKKSYNFNFIKEIIKGSIPYGIVDVLGKKIPIRVGRIVK